MPKCRYIYDFKVCDGFYSLKALIDEINLRGYVLISVTQHEHVYTVFWRIAING